MSNADWLRAHLSTWRALAFGALACAIIAVITLLASSRSLLSALLTPPPSASQVDLASLDSRGEAFDRSYDERYLAELNARWLFFRPPTPPPPARPVEQRPREEPPPPPPPARYGGPQLIAIFDNHAWFGDGVRLAIGDEFDDLQVLDMTPPWDVRVRWKGVEFTLDLFLKDKIVLPESP